MVKIEKKEVSHIVAKGVSYSGSTLLGLSYVIRKDLLWSKAWNGKWAQNWQI